MARHVDMAAVGPCLSSRAVAYIAAYACGGGIYAAICTSQKSAQRASDWLHSIALLMWTHSGGRKVTGARRLRL